MKKSNLAIRQNPDKEYFKEMQKILKSTNGYCGELPMKGKDFKCICKQFFEQTEPGYCAAGLYYKEESEN